MGDDATNSTTNAPAPVAVYLYAGDQIIENVTTSNLYFQDSLGNTSHVTDAAGNLLESYTYDAFGTPTFYNATSDHTQSAPGLRIKHLFQGQLWTQETRLNDYRNRVELPTMGVFLQPDPIGFKGDAANLYRFCGNDAVNRTDPTGLYVERAIDFDPGLQGPGRDSAERMAENNRNNLARLELTFANIARAAAQAPRAKGQQRVLDAKTSAFVLDVAMRKAETLVGLSQNDRTPGWEYSLDIAQNRMGGATHEFPITRGGDINEKGELRHGSDIQYERAAALGNNWHIVAHIYTAGHYVKNIMSQDYPKFDRGPHHPAVAGIMVTPGFGAERYHIAPLYNPLQ
jgi:RHS repeat-associated protein